MHILFFCRFCSQFKTGCFCAENSYATVKFRCMDFQLVCFLKNIEKFDIFIYKEYNKLGFFVKNKSNV